MAALSSEGIVGRFRIPLLFPFRGVSSREGIIVRGEHGFGEVSPFPTLNGGPEQSPHYLAAMEAAGREFPQPVRDEVPVHATIPELPPQAAHDLAKAFGCPSAKVKVGEGDDEGRVAAVRDALGPNGRISVDANAAWDVEMAVRAIRRLERFGIELVEQPVFSIEEMAAVRARIDVPIAADESVDGALDWHAWTALALGTAGAEILQPLVRIAKTGAADALVLKPQRLGGIRNALRVVETTGLPGIASNLIETSIGLAAGIALAAALPELPYSCGLATQPLLAGDLTDDPLLPEGGLIRVRRPQLNVELLRHYEVTDA